MYKTSITELSSSIGHLESLESLDLSYCTNFEKFPDIIEGNLRNLRELNLEGTAIRGLPRSIGYLECLETLNLSYCPNLHKFPEIERNMERIEELYLNNTAIVEFSFLNRSSHWTWTSPSEGVQKLEKHPKQHL